MITERDISTKFSVIWNKHFPMLTSNFIRVFNEAQVEKFIENKYDFHGETRYDIISELGFNITHLNLEHQQDLAQLLKGISNSGSELVKNTAASIWQSGKYSVEDLSFSESELLDLREIVKRLIYFTNNYCHTPFKFKPLIPGYGFLNNVEADLSAGDTLYEIKTVNRNFRSSDLKQLILYLALKSVTGDVTWKYGGLFNPRRGTFCRFNVESLIYTLSGGFAAKEVFENFLNELIRDIHLDSKF